jgi:hypothetical protein
MVIAWTSLPANCYHPHVPSVCVPDLNPLPVMIPVSFLIVIETVVEKMALLRLWPVAQALLMSYYWTAIAFFSGCQMAATM